jgi:predicted nucleic acid-binding protein
VLLDTNIVIALFAGVKPVRERLAECPEVFLPSTVPGELYYGARKSSQASANLARIEELAAVVTILSCDATTARLYGEIKASLRSRGRPYPKMISGLPPSHSNTVCPWPPGMSTLAT